MTEREDEFAVKIKGYLDRSAADLKPGHAYRLRQAREAALARLDGAVPVAVDAVELAGAHGFARVPVRRSRKPLYSLVALVFVAVVSGVGYQQWRAYTHIQELEELDAQILASDLPIDAYLDGGFQTWLKTSLDN
ncbi:MAG: DUF3619 family protein [Proteobacteria bacterium]|nr:DUF3619 family protein [Pseudomonadota bacterium]